MIKDCYRRWTLLIGFAYIAQNNFKISAGFIHLPPLPEQVVSKNPPVACMALETMVTGIRAAMGVIQAER